MEDNRTSIKKRLDDIFIEKMELIDLQTISVQRVC